MTFGQAIEELKQGKKMRRSFWKEEADKESIRKIRKMIISSEFKRNPMQTFKILQI